MSLHTHTNNNNHNRIIITIKINSYHPKKKKENVTFMNYVSRKIVEIVVEVVFLCVKVIIITSLLFCPRSV